MLAMLTIPVCVYVFVSYGRGDEGRISAASPPVAAAAGTPLAANEVRVADVADTQRITNASVAMPDGFPPFSAEVHITETTDTQYLKLVNRERAITTPVSHTRLVNVWPDMPASTAYVRLHETAFAAVRELFAAAQSADIGSLFIASGYRSHEHQSNLYANAADRRYVMTPGHSEHQLGLAADILTSSHNFQTLKGTPEAQWLAENAPQFGLILRYPQDKEHITGVAYEPWHFRYVGRIHAWYMGKHGLVLEEYIEYLQAQGGYRAEFSGRTYYVLYQRPENGMILVPEDLTFWVSSANTGGYVVTAWR